MGFPRVEGVGKVSFSLWESLFSSCDLCAEEVILGDFIWFFQFDMPSGI